jgi:hypothetical protein
MKHNPIHLSKTTTTVLLAVSFLSLVMFLSYLFMAATMGR